MASASELAAELERLILDGELAPGARLDPVRVAAERLDLAPNTVASAYKTLSDKGLVVGQGRRGTFVQPRFQPAGELVAPIPPGVVDLASGRPDPALLPDLAPFLAGLGGSATTYGDPQLAPELDKAGRRTLSAEALPVEHLGVTGGAVDGVERALGAWLGPGDRVAVEDPGWFAMVDLIRAMGLVPVPVLVDEEGMTVAGLEAVLENVKAVVMVPRAQNPTGAAVTGERARLLSELLTDHPEVLTIEDDHIGPVAAPSLHPVGPGRERWVLIRSFSKALGPDLRVAILTGDAVTVERVMLRQMVGPGWVSHILQRAVAAMLDSGEVAACLETAARTHEERRRLVVDALMEAGLEPWAGSGVNVWIPVPDEDMAVQSALRRGYAVRAGRRFRHRAGPGVRVTTSQLEEGMASELARALAGEPPDRVTRGV